MQVSAAVSQFLLEHEPWPSSASLVVAFSGGPDSTALLHALRATVTPTVQIIAAHLDHAIDSGSRARAGRARELAEQIGTPFVCERRPVPSERIPGESLEAAARRIRYAFLHETAARANAAAVLTAHHADDQVETVVLRLIFGSGLAGLAGIPMRRGTVHRPLLDVDRREILAYLRHHGLEPVHDPTNADTRAPRNAIRHLLLPALRSTNRDLDECLINLARAASGAVHSIDRRLIDRLCPDIAATRISCPRGRFDRLPRELATHAVGTLCRTIAAKPPSGAAVADVLRQLDHHGIAGTDLGAGWRLEADERTISVLREPGETDPATPFAYTLTVPGEVFIEELALVFRLRRSSVERWMFHGRKKKAGMSLPVREGDHVTIRTRQPGDRIQPLGSDFQKRLKNVLIDQKIPTRERDRLPLLCVNGKIVWIPGVTIDHTVRLADGETAWVAEIEPAPGRSA